MAESLSFEVWRMLAFQVLRQRMNRDAGILRRELPESVLPTCSTFTPVTGRFICLPGTQGRN
jgi:hypothetical protein